MAEQAKFIPEGIAKGIDDNAKTVYDSMKELSNGIMVNPQDFAIDTNQFIDYKRISGVIATQSDINIDSNVSQRIYEAVIAGMRNAKIKAEVEVKADEKGIFKVVQSGAEEYAIQTGENPFPVMA